MPMDKKKVALPATAQAPRKHNEPGRHVTSQRIDADLAAFHASGGRIEVLGTTYVDLRKKKPPANPGDEPTG